MAKRRMFSLEIVDTDAFLDMPSSTQSLYFHFGMRADDEGFVGNPQRLIRMLGVSSDDYKLLVAKGFVIPFDSGVCVIKHWKMNNYLQNDRLKATTYLDEKKQLITKENKAYTLDVDTNCIHRVVKGSIEESSIGKSSIIKHKKSSAFVKPTVEEIFSYCKEKDYKDVSEELYDFYESKGWLVGKNKMKDWKAAVRNWIRRNNDFSKTSNKPKDIDEPELLKYIEDME